MAVKKLLFVGCGDGKELLFFAGNPKVKITGIEPIKLNYSEAKRNLLSFPQISLLNCRIQDIKLRSDSNGFDEVFMIFPTPQVIEHEKKEIIRKIKEILKKQTGSLNIYTEVHLPDWPDQEDCNRFSDFIRLLEENNFKVIKEFILYEELPIFIKKSACGTKFYKHGIRKYMFIKGIKL